MSTINPRRLPRARNRPRRPGERWGGWIAGAALAAFALFFIANRRWVLDPRVANRTCTAVRAR